MELEVEVVSEEIIKPYSPTPPQLSHYELSSLDRLSMPVYNHLVMFYPTENDDDKAEMIKLLKQSVANAVTDFYPLAGRFNDDCTFVDCNDEGVPFKEAHVKCQLSDFLQNPVPKELNKLYPFSVGVCNASEIPMGIQFNTFDCGGIGLALCISHKIGDALSYFNFLNTWAAIARGDQNKVVLPELVSGKLFPPWTFPLLPKIAEVVDNNPVVTKRFVFSASKLEEIRTKYAAGDSGILETQRRPSRVESLSAFLWSRFVTVTKKKSNSNSFHTIIHTVNLRTKFEPPLPVQSFGNIYRTAVTIPALDKDGNCNNLVSQVRDSIRRIDKEYVKKLQVGEDLNAPKSDEEGGKSLIKIEPILFIFTSLCRFPIYEADFGWGKPIWAGIANWTTKNIVVFMDTPSGDGIEAWVSLVEEDMAAFASDPEILLHATVKSS